MDRRPSGRSFYREGHVLKTLSLLVSSLRPKQWVKNGFLFLPLVFGKKIFSYPENVMTIAAFFLFSFCSSAVYLINDVMDIESDRKHPKKYLRPIAAGRFPVPYALTVALCLGAASLMLSFLLDVRLGWVMAIYLGMNLLYSRFLKHKVIVDVLCIGLFFLLRIGAGSVVAHVDLSHWILFMTALLALFLGFNKRRQELQQSKTVSSHRKVLGEYDDYFIDQMNSVITASIVVVYMLYTVDAETVRNFGTTHLIYTIPFVYYGIFRYLYLVHKARIEGDPTEALLTDLRMQVNIALWIGACIAVIYFRF